MAIYSDTAQTVDEEPRIENAHLYHEMMIGSLMISAIKNEQYEHVVALIKEMKRRIADETVDDDLFYKLCTADYFREHFDPICFFE